MIICFKNLRAKVQEKQPLNIWLHSSYQAITAIFVTEVLITIASFVGQSLACSANLNNVLSDLFIFQLMQYGVHFFVNSFYYYKVHKEIQLLTSGNVTDTKKIKEEDNNNNVRLEIFNASFALNETKSEANMYDIKNRQREQTIKIDMSHNTNTSHFTMSNMDNTKIGSTISADSVLNMRKFHAFRRTPRKKVNHVKDIEFAFNH